MFPLAHGIVTIKPNQAGVVSDLFITNESAPIVDPRSCEPVGNIDIINTATGVIDISSQMFQMTKPTAGQGWDAYGFFTVQSHQRTVGMAIYTVARSSSIDRVYVGAFFSTAAISQGGLASIRFSNTAALALTVEAGVEGNFGASLSVSTDYSCLVVELGNGYAFFIKGGTQYPDFTLLFVSSLGITETLYGGVSNFNSQLGLDRWGYLKLCNLNNNYDLTSVIDPCPQDGDSYDADSGDFLTYFVWTPATSETMTFSFRFTDSDNTYELVCDQVAGTIRLYRIVATVPTELDAGKTQTWAVNTDYRIGIIAAGGRIQTVVAGVIKHTVTGETFNLTETGVVVEGFASGANLEIWRRTFEDCEIVGEPC